MGGRGVAVLALHFKCHFQFRTRHGGKGKNGQDLKTNCCLDMAFIIFFIVRSQIMLVFFSFHPSTIQQKENKHPSPSWAPMGDTSEFRKPESPLAQIAGLNLSLPKQSRWHAYFLKKQTASSSE